MIAAAPPWAGWRSSVGPPVQVGQGCLQTVAGRDPPGDVVLGQQVQDDVQGELVTTGQRRLVEGVTQRREDFPGLDTPGIVCAGQGVPPWSRPGAFRRRRATRRYRKADLDRWVAEHRADG